MFPAALAVLVVPIALTALGWTQQRRCPRCATRLPAFRRPDSARQLLWGGWTCPTCHAHLDRRGRLLDRGDAQAA